MPKRKEDFLVKLKALLTEYNVEIHWDYSDCSDMHGVSDEEIVFETTWRTPSSEAFTARFDGQCMDEGDIK